MIWARPLIGSTSTGNFYCGQYLKDLLVVLTRKEIKIRYKNSWLGYAWSILNPLAFAFIYSIAFGVVMRVQVSQYPLFLLAGLFPWQWLSHSFSAAPNIFLANATLIKKVRFPWNMLVASTVLNDAVHFVLSIPIIMGFLALYQSVPSWSWLIGIPLLVLEQFVMIYGFALTIASLNLFFRDLDRLTALMITFLFFLTPITYSSSMVPDNYQVFLYLNPMAPLMLSWQQLFLTGTLSWPFILTGYVIALLSFGMGSLIYRKLSLKFAEVV
jgi:lipopolysaccharide transport system permease protein